MNSRKKGHATTPIRHNTDSPILWLGKFVFNGLPTKIFDFKSPYSPLYWVKSLGDVSIPSAHLDMARSDH